MKLTRIAGTEPTVKHSFSFKKSTAQLLQKYVEFYEAVTKAEVSVKDVTEQILLDFMADDKAFQRYLRQPKGDTAGTEAEHPAVQDAVPAPVQAHVTPATPEREDDARPEHYQ